jgi:hypothetical protein
VACSSFLWLVRRAEGKRTTGICGKSGYVPPKLGRRYNTSIMYRAFAALLLAAAFCVPSAASPLATNARTVLPSKIQQILSVDYRSLRNSSSGMALKKQVLPNNLKSFERSLRDLGINPDSDLEQITFVSYRTDDRASNGRQYQVLRSFGVATGIFQPRKLLARMKTKKVRAKKYRDNWIWPASNGFQFVFLDDGTMLFGEPDSVKDGLDVRDGERPGVASSTEIAQNMADVQSAPIWSVLDKEGTQNMLRSVLGEASALADYESIKKRLLGSYYSLDLQHGVDFGLDVGTSDSFTAGTLSALLNAGILYKKAAGSAAEKSAVESMKVNSDSSHLEVRFQADDSKFQALLQSDLFQAVSR